MWGQQSVVSTQGYLHHLYYAAPLYIVLEVLQSTFAYIEFQLLSAPLRAALLFRNVLHLASFSISIVAKYGQGEQTSSSLARAAATILGSNEDSSQVLKLTVASQVL